jgi:carbohydrate-binding DOMON domain-containing protein
MSFTKLRITLLALAAGLLIAGPALAVTFDDPTGDDNGPGTYVYPTDAVYTPGSFDLTKLEVTTKGNNVDIAVSVNANLDDPWRMGTGFAVQMVFVFIKTGDGGHTEGLPGLNIQFAEDAAWNKVVILSPQGFSRVNQEVEAKASALADDIVIPRRVRGSGRTISASVKLADLGGGDPETWGYQVVMQSNEGFPADTDLLTRKVNEFEGQHRFGGGSDYDCDPHVMDVLGDQAAQLAYECGPSGESKKMATLTMVYK